MFSIVCNFFETSFSVLVYLHIINFFMITSNGTADRDTIKKEEKWKHKNIFLDTGHYFKMMIIKFATFFSLIGNIFYFFIFFLACR